MNDTPAQIEEKMREMIHKKTPEERLKMGYSMFELSKSLVIHSLLEECPNLSYSELRKELFLRFYRYDFDPAQRQKITAYLLSLPQDSLS